MGDEAVRVTGVNMDGEIITENRARLEARLRECAATLVDLKTPIPDRLDRVSNALSRMENEIRNCYDESAPGVRYVVRPGSALAPEGIIRRGAFLGCSEIEELVVDEGIVEMEDFWWEGLPRLRRMFLPASLKTLGDSIRDPVEEVVFAQGCTCRPYFLSSTLKRIVWPSGCESCDARTFGGGQNLAEVVGLEVLKCVDVDAFWGMEHCKLSLPDDFKLTRLGLNNDVPPVVRPFIERHRDRAMSMLATVKDLSQPVSARVDAWLNLTSSNLLVRALPDDVRDQALRTELPMLYRNSRPKWPDNAERLPKSASAGGQKGIAEMEQDNYSAMRITLDMTIARPTLKWLDYAWMNKKQGILSGFLRDRHPLMKKWLDERWKGPLAFLLENISNANIPKKAIVDWFPDVARSPICGCSRLLWELFLCGNNWGDHWLWWNREYTPKEMQVFVANCERAAPALLQLGADPDMKGAPLHFSWNDILDGLRRKCKE